MTKKVSSLKTYLRKHFIIIGVVIALLNSVMIVAIYHRAQDDSAEYYLTDDVMNAAYSIENSIDLPENTEFIQYYIGTNQLPKRYTLPQTIEHLGIYHFDFLESYDYLMPYLSKSNKPIYVVHSIKHYDEDLILNISIPQLIFLVTFMAMSFLLLSSTLIYRTINNSVGNLYDWVKSLQPKNSFNKTSKDNNINSLKDSNFIEIQTIADSLKFYIHKNEKNLSRERENIRKLSHELRTPMAITQVALDILDNKTLSKSTLAKLNKIRKANNDMIETTTLILDMWQSENLHQSKDKINPLTVINAIIADLQSTHERLDLDFLISINSNLTVEKRPFILLLTNLLKNIFEHAMAGQVSVKLENTSLVFQNKIPQISHVNQDWHNSNYGMGLSIVKMICEHQDWTIKINYLDACFTTTIDFNTKH